MNSHKVPDQVAQPGVDPKRPYICSKEPQAGFD